MTQLDPLHAQCGVCYGAVSGRLSVRHIRVFYGDDKVSNFSNFW